MYPPFIPLIADEALDCPAPIIKPAYIFSANSESKLSKISNKLYACPLPAAKPALSAEVFKKPSSITPSMKPCLIASLPKVFLPTLPIVCIVCFNAAPNSLL